MKISYIENTWLGDIKMNSSSNGLKGWINNLPTKASRSAVKVALSISLGVPGLLAALTNLTSYPIFSSNIVELLVGTLLLVLVTCLVAFLVALISVVKHCRTQDEKIKSLEKDLNFEQAIFMMDEIAKINRSS